MTEATSPNRASNTESADGAKTVASSAAPQLRRVFDVPVRPAQTLSSTQIVGDSDWVDLYQIVGVSADAAPRDIEEAIINCGADALFFAFSRGYKPLSVQLLEQHQGELRAILLDPVTRRRYDEQCSLHRNSDERAISYEAFLKTVAFPRQGGCLSTLVFLVCLGSVVHPALAVLREMF
ncbi:MAG TPA: hypothetical protein VF600_00070 [Abditibacteriaceae bacterium]